MKKPVIKKKTLSLNATKPQIRRPPPPGMRRPNFASLSLPAIENPLDAEPLVEQGLQEDVDEETSVALQAVLDERKERRDRYRITNDPDYYFLVCFQSVDQKKEFLEKIGWDDWSDDKFVDGLKVAQRLGVDVEPINLPQREFRAKTPVDLREWEVIGDA